MIMLKKLCVCVATVIAVVGIIACPGCFKNEAVSLNKDSGTSVSSNPYSVDYKICAGLFVEQYGSIVEVQPFIMEVTVKGPMAKLAVVLTSSKGKSTSGIIQSDEMISNCATVHGLRMGGPPDGPWTLTIKTFEPEKVVFKQQVTIPSG